MLENLDKYQIILASNSPRRKELMSGLGVDYVVRTLPDVDESYPADLSGAEIPAYISREKADAYRAIMQPGERPLNGRRVLQLHLMWNLMPCPKKKFSIMWISISLWIKRELMGCRNGSDI